MTAPVEGPKRVQLSRKKGWRKPEGVVNVARPSKWGNPFRVGDMLVCHAWGPDISMTTGVTPDLAVALYRRWLNAHRELHPTDLAGHDLACWCPLDQPCHADVLLEMANP